jgi:hypothetical protein
MVESVVDKIDAQLPLRAPLSGREASFSFLVDEHFEEVKGHPLQVTVTLDLEGDMTGLKIELYPAEFSSLSSPLVWINTAPARPVTSTLQRSLMGMQSQLVANNGDIGAHTGVIPAAASAGLALLPTTAEAGPSGMGSQQQLGASTSAIPAAATPANLPAAHLKGNFYTITATFGQARYNRMMNSNQRRLDQLTALGCTTFTDANDISQRCNSMPGQYLGRGIYAYRNLVFNGQIVNAYRRIDSSGRVMDFRLLAIERGAMLEENQPGEEKIVCSMQIAEKRGVCLRKMGLKNRGETSVNPLSYLLSNSCIKNIKRREDDFTRLGFEIPRDVVGLVRQCEAKVDNVEKVNIVPLTSPNGTPFLAAWITRDNETVSLLAQQKNEDPQAFDTRAKDFKTRSIGQTRHASMSQSSGFAF